MLVSCRLTLWMNALRQSFYRLKQPRQTQWVERHGCRINLSLTMTNIPELAPETDVLLSIVVRAIKAMVEPDGVEPTTS